MNNYNIRALIADSLVEMERSGTYLSAQESAVLDKYDHIAPRDKAFYKRVMDGVYENLIRIDYILDRFSKTPVSKMKPVIRAILRMSVYQLMWMDSVPDAAVCNEAVKLASKRGFAGLKGYVNGVIRSISRDKDNVRYPSKDDDPAEYLSVMYSCPVWITDMLADAYGYERTESILASYTEQKPLSLRLRTSSREGADRLRSGWESAGITSKANPHIPYGCLLSQTGSVTSIPGYDDGSFIVQDTGSMMVCELAGIRPGDIVLDLCAAPGGKSIHAADKSASHVYSYDISETRCDRISENVARLGLEDMISVEAHDATVFIPDMAERADVVIADVPCSGFGVMGHKSDIRYRVRPEDIDSLTALQRNIVDTAVRYVRPGGRLVYSTCTINRRENEEQAAYIIDKYGFGDITSRTLAQSRISPPGGFTPGDGPGLQILPDIWTSDGFYICVLELSMCTGENYAGY